MKQKYEKPMLYKEEFTLENTIAACVVVTKEPSILEHCSYVPEGLGFPIFAEDWSSCYMDGTYFDTCYYEGANNLFNS